MGFLLACGANKGLWAVELHLEDKHGLLAYPWIGRK